MLTLMTLEQWLTIAAAVQAAAAVVIVVITFFLARYAKGATKAAQHQADVSNQALVAASRQAEVGSQAVDAANRQAEIAAQSLQVAMEQASAAHQSVRELQRQAQLRSVGLLRLGVPSAIDTDKGLMTLVEVVNGSAEPALDIEVTVFGHEHNRPPAGPYGTSPQIPILLPGESHELRIDTQQMKNMPSGVRRRDGGGQPLRPDPVYSYDRLVLDVEWKSLVGAVTTASFLWYGNAADYEHGWRLREVVIQPWGDGTDEVRVEGRP